jgi:hypothetical protein
MAGVAMAIVAVPVTVAVSVFAVDMGMCSAVGVGMRSHQVLFYAGWAGKRSGGAETERIFAVRAQLSREGSVRYATLVDGGACRIR